MKEEEPTESEMRRIPKFYDDDQFPEIANMFIRSMLIFLRNKITAKIELWTIRKTEISRAKPRLSKTSERLQMLRNPNIDVPRNPNPTNSVSGEIKA